MVKKPGPTECNESVDCNKCIQTEHSEQRSARPVETLNADTVQQIQDQVKDLVSNHEEQNVVVKYLKALLANKSLDFTNVKDLNSSAPKRRSILNIENSNHTTVDEAELESLEQQLLSTGSQAEIFPVSLVKELATLEDPIFIKAQSSKLLSYEYNQPYQFRNLDRNTGDLNFPEVGFGENIEKPLFSDEEEKTLIREIDEKLKEVKRNGFSEAQVRRLRKILIENIHAFGTKDSPAKMSSLTPIECHLKDPSKEIIATPRYLGKEQMTFLRKRIDSMVERGLIRKTDNPLYGSQAFLVPKKGPEKYRLVVDMRKLNENTRRSSLLMPNLEQQLSFTKGAKLFGSFDILSGFDYLPVAEASRKYFVLVTWFGAYEFCGSPQGWVNTPQLFQNRMITEILNPIGLFGTEGTGIIQWIDDSLLYSKTFDGYCNGMEKFLQQMIKKGLRLNISKCILMAKEAEWCGRVVSEHGWKYSPKYFHKILNLPKPTFTFELAQALYLINWLSPSIPGLAKQKDVFSGEVKLQSTMKQLKKDNEQVKWTPELDLAWTNLRQELERASKRYLASYDHTLPLCLFTDSSGDYWGLMLTQCTNADPSQEDDETPVREQTHQPIFFLSGKFNAGQQNWHISQKELYPVIYAFKRLPYLMYGHTRRITVFTDHKNLETILHPDWSPKTAYIDRLLRWGLLFQNADICVRHIAGEDNVAADILSRWGQLTEKPKPLAQRTEYVASRVIVNNANLSTAFKNEEISFLSPHYDGSWRRITDEEIRKEQAKEANLSEQDLTELRTTKRGQIIVPWSLVPRLLVHNHLTQLHPSWKDEMQSLRHYKLKLPKNTTLKKVVEAYRKKCLHCQRRPRLHRRPLNLTPISRRPREILHADYLYLAKNSHLLVIVDNATRKVFLRHTITDTAEEMALALLEFLGNFQLLDQFTIYTDNGSYFASKLMGQLETYLSFSRNFSIQYAPWTNGTVEVTNSKLLKVVKSLVSQYELHEKELYKLTGLLMHVMNNSPSPIKAGYTPNQLFMDAPTNPPHMLINSKLGIPYKNKMREPRSVEKTLTNIEEIRKEVMLRLQEAYDMTYLRRTKQNYLYNSRHKFPTLQFESGDWVLVSKAGTVQEQDKTKPVWVGPYQVVGQTHQDVYTVKDLLGKTSQVHAARLWSYAPEEYIPSPAITDVFRQDRGKFYVKKIDGIRVHKKSFQLKVHWLGFDDEVEKTWELLETMYADVPEMVLTFLAKNKSKISQLALQLITKTT
ncbi:MAG: DDE-type integrase/transposase/recombinase [Candidatus Thorarchaeota archaeon]|nr:DDE-type integrase/transposase/recombinase [Candidatus Thorarchaeota archaeon]